MHDFRPVERHGKRQRQLAQVRHAAVAAAEEGAGGAPQQQVVALAHQELDERHVTLGDGHMQRVLTAVHVFAVRVAQHLGAQFNEPLRDALLRRPVQQVAPQQRRLAAAAVPRQRRAVALHDRLHRRQVARRDCHPQRVYLGRLCLLRRRGGKLHLIQAVLHAVHRQPARARRHRPCRFAVLNAG